MKITFLTVFIQGILSFFSPCVLPLIPVYMGYLSGGTLKEDSDGTRHFSRSRVMVNTVFFVVGISFAFFLLGMGLSVIGRFFSGNQLLFVRIGGIIVLMFGLYQLGLFGSSNLLNREVRLPVNLGRLSMSPLTAFVMGFVISFAWSPCIGPVLSSVLIMAASAGSSAVGFLLIGVYTLGYIIPFLLVGVFTTSLLEFFGRHRNLVKYSVKAGAVLMVFMGVLMFTGKLNDISSYLSRFTGVQVAAESIDEDDTPGGVAASSNKEDNEVVMEGEIEEAAADVKADETADTSTDEQAQTSQGTESDNQAQTSQGTESDEQEDELIPAPDFTLTDQYGEVHSLSDYRGKIIFLNFWATWCPPCRAEMPYIQELYEEYSEDESSDVAILAVAFPDSGKETDAEGVKSFLDENGYTYPVLMDEGASLQLPYYITSFPTTYIINADGRVLGYIPGAMTKEIMEDVIKQARGE